MKKILNIVVPVISLLLFQFFPFQIALGSITITQYPTPSVFNQESGTISTMKFSISSPPKLVTVEIVDMDKRNVIELLWNNVSVTTSGPFSVSWNGKSTTPYGSFTVPNGQYYFKITEKSISGTVLSKAYARISCNGRWGNVSYQGGIMYNPFYWGNFKNVTAYYDINRTDNYISDYMGGTITYDQHRGTDFGCPSYTNLYAVFSGTILEFREDLPDNDHSTILGNYIVIQSSADNTVIVRYLHLAQNSIIPSQYQAVSAGSYVAKSDNTGRSTGPHLHIDISIGTQHPHALTYMRCPYQYKYWIQDPRPDAYPGY